MSMRPRPSHAIPATTAQVARAAFPKGCLAIRIRDALGELFDDGQFAGLFAVRGRPALSPARLALVSVLQFAEGLPDRQAADAVRGRIDWKYALGLELADTGFDAEDKGNLFAAIAALRIPIDYLAQLFTAGFVKMREGNSHRSIGDSVNENVKQDHG